MGDTLFSVHAYFRYWLDKEDQYSQQSPFLYERYTKLISFLKAQPHGDHEIEDFRKSLLRDTTRIEVLDLGAGSKKVPQKHRPISQITKYSTSSSKFALLYQYFCSLTPAQTVLEFGTCMGITTRYLAKVTKGTLYTFEGAEEILKVARRDPAPDKTTFVLGPIVKTLPSLLETVPKVDFVLLDANHTYDATMAVFSSLLAKTHPDTILAIGDIHWNPGMEKAWKEIKSRPEVKLTLDFFECGIVFFSYPGPKSHLTLDV